MARSLVLPVLAAATLASALGFTAAPAAARDAAPYYRAQLAQPAASGRVIAGGVLWLCDGTECVAGKGSARPVIMCQHLAGETAAVVSFSYAGKPLAADELQRCNG